MSEQSTLLYRILDRVERVGNKLPDPAVMFFGLLIIVWVLSWALSGVTFDAKHPLTGVDVTVNNLLAGPALADFFAKMVNTFMSFTPLGVVLVAMLGVGVAERSGFINVAIKLMLNVTPKMLLTPVLILVAIISHTAVDAGYVRGDPIRWGDLLRRWSAPIGRYCCGFCWCLGRFQCQLCAISH